MPCAEYSLVFSCQISPLPRVPTNLFEYHDFKKHYDPEQRQEAQEVKKAQKNNVLPPKPRLGLVPVPSL